MDTRVSLWGHTTSLFGFLRDVLNCRKVGDGVKSWYLCAKAEVYVDEGTTMVIFDG